MILLMHTTHVMKVSRNGQVSIPAATRARWKTDHLVVVDLGDHIVMRPASPDPVSEVVGKYAGRRSSSEKMRRAERQADADRERRRE
jgi:bifunctional DNA-binding transcriptional regulator/antitoxin component of YhaV-PrlF toxin-antitoxin module